MANDSTGLVMRELLNVSGTLDGATDHGPRTVDHGPWTIYHSPIKTALPVSASTREMI